MPLLDQVASKDDFVSLLLVSSNPNSIVVARRVLPALARFVGDTWFSKAKLDLPGTVALEDLQSDYKERLKSFAKKEPSLTAPLYLMKGYLHLNENQFREACCEFREAIRHKPDSTTTVEEGLAVAIAKYYNLRLQNDENLNDDYNLPIPRSQVRKLAKDTAAVIVEDLRAPELKPFPVMSEDGLESFKKHAKKNQWNDRQKRGWPYHTNAFKYLHVTYGQWIPGLTREHLASADPSLHAHLKKKISLEGMPEWLDVPSGPDARKRAITDPNERAKLEMAREYLRERQREHVQRKTGRGHRKGTPGD